MKIKCCSIEGEIANPLKNEKLMEKEIELAIEEEIDLLVFPGNSLNSDSVKSIANNFSYQKNLEIAERKLSKFINSHRKSIKIVYHNESYLEQEEKIMVIADNNFIEFLGDKESELKELKRISKEENSLIISCCGRGTESVCSGIYSNLKAIVYKGKILISNSYDNKNDLIFDFNYKSYLKRFPFLPGEPEEERNLFEDILEKQTYGLIQKMKRMHREKIVIGISGGLDSTVSFLVCVEAFKKANLPLENIIAITMPGFGTSKNTYKNALKLMDSVPVTTKEIDLKPLLKMHLKNIEQPKNLFDLTYEQTQSRERTQVLLDFANKENAIMIGTGCMSEFALGWMTYGGDHLSMFAINVGLPKTVVKKYAQWFISKCQYELRDTISSILNSPVSPELLPINKKGEQKEKTEELIGSYELQDFFIYHTIKSGYSVYKIFEMACFVFDEFDKKYIFDKLKIFTNRFFSRQYKKNCYGDGLQIFDYSVSPFIGFSMASDINDEIWKEELVELEKELYK